MPSICLVADTHRRHRELIIPQCDLVIHCGDFCSFRQDDPGTLEDADRWFGELPTEHVVCIAGNHDFPLQSHDHRFSNAIYLEDELVEVAGLSIYGSPWVPDLSSFAFYGTTEWLVEKWRKIPAGIDVLVTHTPPGGILDLPTSGNVHLGCPYLRDELKRIQPKLHAFGHVHASHGQFREHGTTYANAAVAGGSDFRIMRPPTMISLPWHGREADEQP